jgi:hypothetical protein
MYRGICRKLRERQPLPEQQPGVIRVDHSLTRRDQYIQQHWGKLAMDSVEPDCDAEKAKWAGYQAGLDTEIHSGVKGSDAPEAVGAGGVKLLNG